MSKTISHFIIGLFFSLNTSLLAADLVPLDIKYGRWKNELTEKLTGAMPQGNASVAMALKKMEEMAKKYPQMAAQYEQTLKTLKEQQAIVEEAQKGSCITEKDMKNGIAKALNQNPKDDCKNTILTSTGSQLKGKVVCKKGTHEYDLQVKDSKTIQVHVKMDGQAQTEGQKMRDLNFKMYWVSDDC